MKRKIRDSVTSGHSQTCTHAPRWLYSPKVFINPAQTC